MSAARRDRNLQPHPVSFASGDPRGPPPLEMHKRAAPVREQESSSYRCKGILPGGPIVDNEQIHVAVSGGAAFGKGAEQEGSTDRQFLFQLRNRPPVEATISQRSRVGHETFAERENSLGLSAERFWSVVGSPETTRSYPWSPSSLTLRALPLPAQPRSTRSLPLPAQPGDSCRRMWSHFLLTLLLSNCAEPLSAHVDRVHVDRCAPLPKRRKRRAL